MGGRRRWALILAGPVWLAVVLALAGAWGWRDLSAARADLEGARGRLQSVAAQAGEMGTAERRKAMSEQVRTARELLASAESRVRASPPVSATRFMPLLGRQRAGLLALVDDADAGAGAAERLLATVEGLAGSTQLRDGVAPLDALGRLQAEVAAARDVLAATVRPDRRLWGPLGRARRRFDRTARAATARLDRGADALDVARRFLGSRGPRRYFVALQNNAEMRDQGIVLAYAVLAFDRGRLNLEQGAGSVGRLPLDGPSGTPVPPGTETVFGSIRPTALWHSVNATADFAWSGRAMADMYRQATGQRVDGVIGIDVPGLAALLRVVGPVTAPGFARPLTADNLARVLLHDLYQGLPPQTDPTGAHYEAQAVVAQAVVGRLAGGGHDALALGRELGAAAAGGHLRLWSAAADEEALFERVGLGGGPAVVAPERTFHLAVENRTATKLDYYVRPSVLQQVRRAPRGAVVVRTTVVVDNRAPVGAAPSYQLGPDDFTKRPGDYIAWVLLWVPAGSVQPDGTPESGLNLAQRVVEVPAGERREAVFETLVPNAVRGGRFEMRLVPQPRLEPMELEVRLEGAGWGAGQPRSWRGTWDRVRTLTWRAS